MAAQRSGVEKATAVGLKLCLLVVAVFLTATNAYRQYQHLSHYSAKKDARCHIPQMQGCNSSIYPILNHKYHAWFYHTIFRSCRPMYTHPGEDECPGNRDLFKSRDECEKICGDVCHYEGAYGVCAFDDQCEKSERIINSLEIPCAAYGVSCCNRPGPPELMPAGYTQRPRATTATAQPEAATAAAAAAATQPPQSRPLQHNRIVDQQNKREPSVKRV